MSTPLRVLVIEDSLDDAELLVRELQGAGYDPVYERVETAAALRATLARQSWDLILADYALPQFSAPAALMLLKNAGLDLPCIVVSGTLGDEAAVECLKHGATDYLRKDRLARLGQAVAQALAQQHLRDEKRRAEATLRESEAHYRLLFENTLEGIFRSTPTGHFTHVNPALVHMLGYTSTEEVLALTLPDDLYVDPTQRERLRTHYEAAGTIEGVELLWKKKDGQPISVSLYARTIRDARGSLIAYEGMALDVTARKQVEKALQYRVEIEQLISAVSTSFIHLAPDEIDSGINRALQTIGEFAGVDRSYVFLFSGNGTKMDNTHEWCAVGIEPQIQKLKRLPVDDLPWVMEKMKRFETIHIPRVADLPCEARVEQAHFQSQAIQSLINVPLVCGGSLIGFLGFDAAREEKAWMEEDIVLLKMVGEIFVNALERKRAEEEKQKLQQQLFQTQKLEALGTLAGGIAHDFNNMLAAIQGFTELTLPAVPASSRVARANLEEVLKACDRAKGLVQQILTFSRPGTQDRYPLQLHLFVKETLQFLRASLPSTIEIRSHIEPTAGVVLANPTQIHRVLMNLAVNARQAMGEKGGVLEIHLQRVEVDGALATQHRNLLHPGPHLRLTVKDTGRGMTPQVMERIFDPFFTTKPVGEGSGLGLSIVHGIVTSHGGAITLESQLGKGTAFHVSLPLSKDAGTVVEEEVSESAMPLGEGRILFVDDEEALTVMGQQMLERLGYKAVVTTSSVEALEIFRKDPQHFDAVVTDQTMPRLTGEELARELLNIRPDVPIILCTGFGETLTLERARAVSFRDYLTKPLSLCDLSDALQRARAMAKEV